MTEQPAWTKQQTRTVKSATTAFLNALDTGVDMDELIDSLIDAVDERDREKSRRKQVFLNFIKKLSSKDLRKLLKIKEFKELTRFCGIPVADQVE